MTEANAAHSASVSIWVASAYPTLKFPTVLNWYGGYIMYYGKRYDVKCKEWGSHGASCDADSSIFRQYPDYVSFGSGCETCYGAYFVEHQ